MPWHPPAGLLTFAPPPLLLLTAAATTASFAGDVAAAAYLLFAEVLAVFGTGSEVALERHSRSRVMALADSKDAAERLERRLQHVPTYEITARLVRFLGNAMLVVGIAYLAFRDRFDANGAAGTPIPWDTFGVVLAVLFALAFLVNDVLVRLLVGRRPNRALVACLPGLVVLRWILVPLRVPLVLLVRLVFRVDLGADAPSPREEILETVEEGEREGSFTPEEADMIESIIEMDTSLVKDVLTPRADVVMMQAETTLDEAVTTVNGEGYSRMPVYGKDRDDVIGVLYAHDLLAHWNTPENPRTGDGGLTVRDLMRKPFFVPENKPLNDLLKEMRARKVHLAVVLDEFNGTEGLVTIEDLLEEIVGEIEDEYDEPEASPLPSAEEVAAGTASLEGRTPIEEVNERLSIELPIEEDFETLGGLVFHQLGKVPAPGDRVDLNGVRITVLEADERTAQTLRVEVLPGETSGQEPAA